MVLVLVVGAPRSGTSWIADSLGRTPGTKYVHEPDGDDDPFAFRARRGFFIAPQLRPGERSPDVERLWDGAFAGGRRPTALRSKVAWRLYRKSPARWRWDAWLGGPVSPGLHAISALAMPLEPDPAARNVVAKTVRAEGYVEWIAARYRPTVVLAERNPLNALASWHELGYRKDPRSLVGPAEYAARTWGLSAPTADAPLIERQAFVYGVIATTLREAADRNPDWIRARHEELCVDPARSMATLAGQVGLEWDESAARGVLESDRDGTGYRWQRRAADQPERWRSRLSPDDADRIGAVLAGFPVDLSD